MMVSIGQVIASKYRIDGVLGQGGMGAVFSAEHLHMGNRCAVKVLHASLVGDEEHMRRFLREAKAAARLKSRHVCKVLDYGKLDNGAPFLVMEQLEGRDLKRVLHERGKLSIGEAALYGVQICSALDEAHRIGIVHRDLKPGNLFLATEPGGAPSLKVLDFGVAKWTPSAGATGPEITKTSAILGTPSYMSPEQMRSSRDVDHRTDLWSMGIILYRMVTGRLPFGGNNVVEVCAEILSGPVPDLRAIVPDLPALFAETILRCLERDAHLRFASAADLAAALLPFAPADALSDVKIPIPSAAPRANIPSIPDTSAPLSQSPSSRTPKGSWVKTLPITDATPPSAIKPLSASVAPGRPRRSKAPPRPRGSAAWIVVSALSIAAGVVIGVQITAPHKASPAAAPVSQAPAPPAISGDAGRPAASAPR